MRKLDEEELQKAREDLDKAQSEFHSAVKSMPSGAYDIALSSPAISTDKHSAGWNMFFMNVGDAFTVRWSQCTRSV